MKRTLLYWVAVAFLSTPAFSAGLMFTLSPAVESGQPGDILIFSGTLFDSDTDNSMLFLNDINVMFTPPGDSFLTDDPYAQGSPNDFFIANVYPFLTGDGNPMDDTYPANGGTAPIFRIAIDPSTPVGVYSGSIDILGGYNDPSDGNVLATQTFQVVVAPEPAMMIPMFSGLSLLVLLRKTT